MTALTPGKELQERVAEAFEKMGVPVIRASIGNLPTDPSDGEMLR